MTDERRQFLEDTRQKSRLLDQAKAQDGTLVDGVALIAESLSQAQPDPVLEPVQVRGLAGRASARPRMGRR